jgi:ABC-2 type transport system ATP-binding protein
MSDIALKVNNVSKSFKIYHQQYSGFRDYFWNLFKPKQKPTLFHALQDISFEVKKGEFYGIIGRNGSGKSTLLKIIAGIYQPDTGSVDVSGRLIPFLELGVGFNPQLTARENVFLNGIILGMTRREVEDKYDEIIDFAEVREFQDMPLKTFSSGMQVRLAFAIAIQAKGDIYLLDEVFAVGDAGFQQKSLKVIEDMMQQGKTIIFVTHDMSSIRKYASNVLFIKDHKVEHIGMEGVDMYLESLGAQ